MPCFDSQAAQERDDAIREAPTLRKMEAVLCAVTNYLGSEVVMKAMDSQDPGVTKTDFLKWWHSHSDNDRVRKASETKPTVLKNVLFIQADVVNSYGVMFTTAALKSAAELFNLRAERQGGIMGELNPQSWPAANKDTAFYAQEKVMMVELEKAAIRTSNLRVVSDIGLVGDVEVMGTVAGDEVIKLLGDYKYPEFKRASDAPFSISMRSMIYPNHDDRGVVKKCTIITFDIMPPRSADK